MSDHTSPTTDNPPFIVLNPDGSYTRLITYPSSLPTSDQDSETPVLSKDLVINPVNKTGVRIHIPKETLVKTGQKLPLIVYYHGGGFVLSTAATTVTHELCDQVAAHLHAVVVNVDYRLAPEHRLPAAYEDGVEALHWIKSTNEPWLTNFVDFSNCYLLGTSAGANLAYHAGLRVTKQILDLEPLKIKGLILHSLFIGGVERTESEIRLANTSSLLTLHICDTMWELALPVDEKSRDHEYCNPMMNGCMDDVGRIKDLGWRVLLTGRNGDLLIDRQMRFAKTLEMEGVECKCFYADGDHGIEYFDKAKAKELCEEILSFISSGNVNKDEKITVNDVNVKKDEKITVNDVNVNKDEMIMVSDTK